MQSFKDVWKKSLVILQNELNITSFESWIKLLIPMKMENDVVAEKDVTVKRIFVKPDEVVGADAPLMEFE